MGSLLYLRYHKRGSGGAKTPKPGREEREQYLHMTDGEIYSHLEVWESSISIHMVEE